MTKKKAKKEIFSVTKAVKSNARDRVGQPRPEKVIAPEARENKQARKHKKTLQDLLKES